MHTTDKGDRDNITVAHSRMNEELRESEARYRAIAELVSDFDYTFRIEPGGEFVLDWIADSFSRNIGFTPEEIEMRGGWGSLIHPDDAPIVSQHRDRLLAGQPDASEFRILTKSGETRWLRNYGRPVWDEAQGRVARIIGAAQDITQRKREAEAHKRVMEQIERAKQEWEATADSLPQLVCLLDGRGHIIRANRTVESWGLGQVVDVKGRDVHGLLHPGCTNEACYLTGFWPRAWEELAQGRPTTCEAEDSFLERHLRVQTQPISVHTTGESEETASFAVVIVHDITARTRAREALRKLSSVVEQTADLVVITDRDGVIEYVNPAFEKFTGYTREEAIGKTPRILKSGKHPQRFYEELWEIILSGKPFHATMVNRKKDGGLYHEEKSITPLEDPQGNITHFVSTGKDITERKRAEEALHELSQFEERQRIAAEMHDGLVQTLGYLGLRVQQVAERLKARSEENVAGELQQIRTTMDRSLQEVRQFIASLKQGPQQPQTLQDRLAEMMTELARDNGPPVELVMRLQAPLLLPPDDAEQVVRVVREALFNAFHHAQAGHVVVRLEREGAEAVAIVEDDGLGFDPQAPPVDGQTHFGLEIMCARAARLRGQLSIRSAPGQGTQVVLRWPVD